MHRPSNGSISCIICQRLENARPLSEGLFSKIKIFLYRLVQKPPKP